MTKRAYHDSFLNTMRLIGDPPAIKQSTKSIEPDVLNAVQELLNHLVVNDAVVTDALRR